VTSHALSGRRLRQYFWSEVLNWYVKISILACFGDIALTIGQKFEPYLETAITLLRQVATLQANPVCVNAMLALPLLVC
jgi:hypothetical protein